MLVLLAIFVFILALLKDSEQRAKSKAAVNKMSKEGRFLPRSCGEGTIIYQDIWYDWKEDRSLFPKEYIKYLERNNNALGSYIIALQSKEEIKRGFQPTYCFGNYNKHTHDPFQNFNTRYKEKIKIYNETGKYYY